MPRAHITINGDPWCNWTGCHAGREIMNKTGPVPCEHRSAAAAERAAEKLRPHFKPGLVVVVAKPCSEA